MHEAVLQSVAGADVIGLQGDVWLFPDAVDYCCGICLGEKGSGELALSEWRCRCRCRNVGAWGG